jgi:hypothetical protein
MKESVDKVRAREILLYVIEEETMNVDSALTHEQLREIFHGNHLTFKYILLTALLSKSVNNKVNSLSLQTGSNDAGAYDARSVCHQVIVRIEEEYLGNRLGGSNEPFLNKPARYKSVSLDNPVRSGKDQRLMTHLHEILVLTNSMTPNQVLASLSIAIEVIMELDSRVETTVTVENPSISSSLITNILNEILSSSMEGQSSVLVFGTLMKLVHGNEIVICHPVNQAGSSSNEIGDIDFRYGNETTHCAEIKDKEFFEHDVRHAANKAIQGGCNRLLIVSGLNGKISDVDESGVENLVTDYEAQGLDLEFIELGVEWIASILATFSDNRLRGTIGILYDLIEEIRASDLTRTHVKSVMERNGLTIQRV